MRVKRGAFPLSKLFALVLMIGFGVLIFTLVYPFYMQFHRSPSEQSQQPSVIDRVIDGLQEVQWKTPPVKLNTVSTKGEQKEDSEQTEEESEYQAPVQSPFIYSPQEPVKVIEEKEEEEPVPERVREEVPDYFKDRSPLEIEPIFQDVDPKKGDIEKLPKDQAIQFGQREPGLRDEAPQAVDEEDGVSSGISKESTEKPSAREAQYLARGWKKFTSYKKAFTVWVPGDLFYVATRDAARTEVYQCDADGIFYGLQRRKLDAPMSDLGDAQMRAALQKAFIEWQGDFAAGIPGFKVISTAFGKDKDQRRMDALMGSDAGQVKLRIFTTPTSIYWMWTVYLHSNKQRADHMFYLNSLQIIQP